MCTESLTGPTCRSRWVTDYEPGENDGTFDSREMCQMSECFRNPGRLDAGMFYGRPELANLMLEYLDLDTLERIIPSLEEKSAEGVRKIVELYNQVGNLMPFASSDYAKPQLMNLLENWLGYPRESTERSIAYETLDKIFNGRFGAETLRLSQWNKPLIVQWLAGQKIPLDVVDYIIESVDPSHWKRQNVSQWAKEMLEIPWDRVPEIATSVSKYRAGSVPPGFDRFLADIIEMLPPGGLGEAEELEVVKRSIDQLNAEMAAGGDQGLVNVEDALDILTQSY